MNFAVPTLCMFKQKWASTQLYHVASARAKINERKKNSTKLYSVYTLNQINSRSNCWLFVYLLPLSCHAKKRIWIPHFQQTVYSFVFIAIFSSCCDLLCSCCHWFYWFDQIVSELNSSIIIAVQCKSKIGHYSHMFYVHKVHSTRWVALVYVCVFYSNTMR